MVGKVNNSHIQVKSGTVTKVLLPNEANGRTKGLPFRQITRGKHVIVLFNFWCEYSWILLIL